MFFFSSRRRHTRCALVTGVQTCALPILMRKYGISAEQSRANSGRLASIAGELGFAFNRGPDFRMRNSFDAHRLLTWAGAIEEPDQDGPTGVPTDLQLALFKDWKSVG